MKSTDFFASSVGWSLIREDCELGLDGLLAALDTLALETNSEPQQKRLRSGVMDRLCASIQIAVQALDEIRTAEILPETGDSPESAPSNAHAFAFGLKDSDVMILQYAAEGMVDKMIAQQLNRDPNWVHHRWRSVRSKLGAADRSHAVGIAITLGLIRPPSQAVRLLRTGSKSSDLN